MQQTLYNVVRNSKEARNEELKRMTNEKSKGRCCE